METGTDFRILRGDGYQGKILRGDRKKSEFAWGQIFTRQFCLGTDINTKFSDSDFEKTVSAIRFLELLIFLFDETNVTGFVRINTMLHEGCKDR